MYAPVPGHQHGSDLVHFPRTMPLLYNAGQARREGQAGAYNLWLRSVGRKVWEKGRRANAAELDSRKEFVYDALGRLIRAVLPFNGATASVKEMLYGPCGNVIRKRTSSHALGKPTAWLENSYAYDSMGRRLKSRMHDKTGNL